MPRNAERRQTTNEDTPKYLHGSAGSEYVLEWHAEKVSTYKSKSELFKQVTAQEQGVPHASRLAFCMREDAVGTRTSLALRDITCPMSSERAISFAPW